jgi:hypothetical protein
LAVAVFAGSVLLAVAGWWALGHRRAKPAAPVAVTPSPAPASAAPTPNGDALTNDGVISMLRGKVAEQVIMQQIRASATRFDLSVPAVIRLTEAGASPELIATMRDPKRPAPVKAKSDTPAPPVAAVRPPSAPAVAPGPADTVPPAPARAIAPVIVPNALPLAIELAEDVPANAEPGRLIHFTLSKELRIGQTVVAPAHTPVVGEIVDGARKKLIGGTKLTFRPKNMTTAGGAVLSLRATPAGGDGQRAVQSTSMPKPPKGVAAVIGTEYIVYTAGEQTVPMPKQGGR